MKRKLKFFKKEKDLSTPTVVLTFTEEEAALLFELLNDELEELMHLRSQHRMSKNTLFNNEELEHLDELMGFCCQQVLNLYKYS